MFSELSGEFIAGSIISPFTAFGGGVLGNWIGLGVTHTNGSPDGPTNDGFIYGAALGLFIPIFLGARRDIYNPAGKEENRQMGAMGSILGGSGMGIATAMVDPSWTLPAVLLGAAVGFAVTRNGRGSPPDQGGDRPYVANRSGPAGMH